MTSGGASIAVHTLDEAAAILRVKPSWLERQAAARKIPFTMLGGSYRFTSDHLISHYQAVRTASCGRNRRGLRAPDYAALGSGTTADRYQNGAAAAPASAAACGMTSRG